jgi:hypothetical protein
MGKGCGLVMALEALSGDSEFETRVDRQPSSVLAVMDVAEKI